MLIMCFCVWQERALDYLSTCIDQVNSFGDILQLVIVELIYKVQLVSWLILPRGHKAIYEAC